MDACKQGDRREKVTKAGLGRASHQERERAREHLVHCRRPAHSRQALTIKIERVNRRRKDPSSESQAGKEIHHQAPGRAGDAASKVMKGDKTTTQVFFSLPRGPHTVVCAVKTLRSLEQDSPESEPERKQPGGF